MQVRELREDEIPRLVDRWFSFACEMADLDSYNELADGDRRPDALDYRRERVELSMNRKNESARALYESRGYGVRRLKLDKGTTSGGG